MELPRFYSPDHSIGGLVVAGTACEVSELNEILNQ